MQRFIINQSIAKCLQLLSPERNISKAWGTSRKRTLKTCKARGQIGVLLSFLFVDILIGVTRNQYAFLHTSLADKDFEHGFSSVNISPHCSEGFSDLDSRHKNRLMDSTLHFPKTLPQTSANLLYFLPYRFLAMVLTEVFFFAHDTNNNNHAHFCRTLTEEDLLFLCRLHPFCSKSNPRTVGAVLKLSLLDLGIKVLFLIQAIYGAICLEIQPHKLTALSLSFCSFSGFRPLCG